VNSNVSLTILMGCASDQFVPGNSSDQLIEGYHAESRYLILSGRKDALSSAKMTYSAQTAFLPHR
jgi:hypothetical protein